MEHVFINNFTHVAVSPFANLVRSTLRRCTRSLFILSICFHFFLSLSFSFHSLVCIFCPCEQFCSAIRTVREDAISGKTSGSTLWANYISALIYFRFFFFLLKKMYLDRMSSRKFHILNIDCDVIIYYRLHFYLLLSQTITIVITWNSEENIINI